MSEETLAAKHSRDYRKNKKAKAERLGIETLSVEVPIGIKKRLKVAMAEHGISQIQELYQTLALNFADASPDLAKQMLKRPSASVFTMKPKHARQLREFAEKGEPEDGTEE